MGWGWFWIGVERRFVGVVAAARKRKERTNGFSLIARESPSDYYLLFSIVNVSCNLCTR